VPIATIPGHREKRSSKTPGKKPRKCFIKTKEHQTVYNIMREFDPPARADSKLRWKTGARFKITHHQKHNLESVPPQQKNHEGIRELDLACDQKSPASPAASKEPVRRIQLNLEFSLNLFLLYTSDLLEMMSSTRSKDLLNSLKLIVSASQTNRCANVEETPVRQRRRLDSYKAAGHVKTSARAAPTRPPFLSQTLRSIESETYTKFATTPESLEQSLRVRIITRA
jgi:hypothetical protein